MQENVNPLNKYDIPPEAIKEQEKFKNYIDQTYETLGQSLGQSIQNEIIKMSTMLTNKYEPFQQIDNFKRISKFNNQNIVRKDKKSWVCFSTEHVWVVSLYSLPHTVRYSVHYHWAQAQKNLFAVNQEV